MVRALRRVGLLLAIGGLGVTAWAGKEPAEYRVGDTVDADLVSPISFELKDPKAAQALESEAIEEVPAVVRYNPKVAAEVVQEMELAVAAMRTNFLGSLRAVYQNEQFTPEDLSSPKFQTLLTTFTNQHAEFPGLGEMAASWATGRSDAEILKPWRQYLREVMKRSIRPDGTPKGSVFGPRLVIYTNGNPAQPFVRADFEKPGRDMQTRSLRNLTRARLDFEQSLPPEQLAVGKYLSGFLRANCTLEAAWTHQKREEYVAARLVVPRISVGQVLAHRGDIVSEHLLRCIQELRAQKAVPTVVAPPNAIAAPAPSPSVVTQVVVFQPAPVLTAPPPPAANSPWWWLAAGGGLVLVLGWFWANRRQPMLPAPTGNGGIDPHAAMRAQASGQLTAWLKQRFVRQLLVDREATARAQRAAAAELAELERKLDEINAPLQDRLRAYEQRVAELEKSLESKDAQNKELIKASIRLTQVQIEAARGRGKLELN